MKLKCPKCGSTKLYHTISVQAKENINTGRRYDVDINNTDGDYETVECENCRCVIDSLRFPDVFKKYIQDNWEISK